MRAIKFRVWDTKMKSMEDDQVAKFWLSQGFTQHIYMQYTGLKDRNGVEIYEGDILDGYCSQGRVKLGAVEWQQTKLRFYAPPRRSMNDADLFERMSSYEVIGNIYDNPELLEANK